MKKLSPHLAPLIAVLGLAIGLYGTPAGSKRNQLSKAELTERHNRAQEYLKVGNFEGVIDLTKKVPKDSHHQDLWTLREYAEAYQILKKPGLPERLPASIRDSYYDSFIALKKGDCAEAYQNMVHVRKYTGRPLDESIYSLCKDRRGPSSEKKWEQLILLTGNKSAGVSK